jgi:hypothetical protein
MSDGAALARGRPEAEALRDLEGGVDSIYCVHIYLRSTTTADELPVTFMLRGRL